MPPVMEEPCRRRSPDVPAAEGMNCCGFRQLIFGEVECYFLSYEANEVQI